MTNWAKKWPMMREKLSKWTPLPMMFLLDLMFEDFQPYFGTLKTLKNLFPMMEVGNWMTLLNILLKKLLMNSRDLIVKAKPRNPSSKNIQNNDNSVCDRHFFVKTPPIKYYGLHSSPLYVLKHYAFFARGKNKLKKT